MDKQITPKKYSKSFFIKSICAAGAILVVGYLAFGVTFQKTYSVKRDHVSISSVTFGSFEDSIPIRGIAAPIKTVFLDAIQGGTVDAIYVSQGDYVKAGQNIIKFKNTAFQLDVYSQEAQVSYQLDINASTRLSLDRNELELNTTLNEVTYKTNELQRRLDMTSHLFENKLVSKNDFDSIKNEHEYSARYLELIRLAQKKETEIQRQKIGQLLESEKRLQNHLSIIRNSLEDLVVKSPIDGQLTSLDVEIGQSREKGARLGQIDKEGVFKLVANVDAFYAARLKVGQKAIYKRDNDTATLVVQKIYPEVINGAFVVDLEFEGAALKDLRRGQDLSLTLILDQPKQTLLVDNAGFFSDTGGNWIFVLEKNGSTAVKRKVKLGRRNSKFIEVISGLTAGEKVVVSSYADYKDMEKLKIY